ncbi:MAG: flavin oxidoreductase/NADH oxidase [Clostridia bacterium]|nr:flavin oxidoreductase/NADH oxidase [Clostridia bacterium]
MKHTVFHYHTLSEVKQEAEKLQVFLPLSEDTATLFQPLTFGEKTADNRIAFLPMEGTDGTETGAPGELTCRRYLRFAQGGPGIIWFEAVSTLPEARASAHQLYLTEENVDAFAALLNDIRETSLRENGYVPVIIMQATNSGRYAKPHGYPEPLAAYHCPPVEPERLPDERIVTDDDLMRFEAAYEKTTKLCQQAGFDGMDIKCCHRYLACELLSAYEREGLYGGSFENRTRFLKNCYRASAAAVTRKDFFLTSRINVYDGYPWPYGFGVARDRSLEPDFTEPLQLIRDLREEFSIPVVNISMGNPYQNPHVSRPYDHGNYVPDEHPICGVSRLMSGIRTIQEAMPDLPVIGSGFSYLRQYSGNLAAGMVGSGYCAMAGFGRMTFADPLFVRELRTSGQMDSRKSCVTCGACAGRLRAGIPAGCLVRDREVYHP